MNTTLWNETKRLEWIDKSHRTWPIGRWALETFRADLFSYTRSLFLLGRDERGAFDREILGVTLSAWRNRSLFAAASFEISSTDAGLVSCFLAVPLAATVSLTVNLSRRAGRMVRRAAEGGPYGHRSLGFSAGGEVWDDFVHVGLWFWNIFFCVRDVLFGRKAYGRIESDEHQTVIAMPEGDYPAVVELRRKPWARPRGGQSGIEKWAVVTLVDEYGNLVGDGRGIPVPPRGDSDDYPLYNDEITVRRLSGVDTVVEAVAKVREEIMVSRTRRAGADWRPEPAAVTQQEGR